MGRLSGSGSLPDGDSDRGGGFPSSLSMLSSFPSFMLMPLV